MYVPCMCGRAGIFKKNFVYASFFYNFSLLTLSIIFQRRSQLRKAFVVLSAEKQETA